MSDKGLGPIYGVELIDALPLDGGMRQAMPCRDDLEAAMRRSERTVAGYEVLLEHYRHLQAVVDKLPLTADGVPVVPGMDVWFAKPSPHCVSVYQVRMHGEIATSFHSSLYRVCVTEEVYSTRAAAEAAAAGQKRKPTAANGE